MVWYDLFPQLREEWIVFHRIEERFQIAVHGVTTFQLPCLLHESHCLMGIAAFAESEATFAELAVPQRSKHLGDGLLDHAIQHRRNA